MLSALIPSEHSYSTMPLTRQSIHQWFVHPGPLVLGATLLKFLCVHIGYKPNCLTTFWTQLAYHFNRRTAEPLGPAPAPGCDEPTSRCQTPPAMWTLGRNQPVIPGVPFIHCAITLPQRITGSLWPTCVSDRNVFLTVKQAFTIALDLPLLEMSLPLHASATL